MEHLAIMKKSWNLMQKILEGKKIIESRWYKSKLVPWDKIKTGDIVYFKNSGGPVILNAEVKDVIQYSNLAPESVLEILNKYGHEIGIEYSELNKYYESFKDKSYCILVFLRNVVIVEPFEISKKGFGMMTAWITVDSIDKIKL